MGLIEKLKGLMLNNAPAAAPAAPSRVVAVAAPAIESANDRRERLLGEWRFNQMQTAADQLITEFGFTQEGLEADARAHNNY